MKILGLVLIISSAFGLGLYVNSFYLSELKKIQNADEMLTTLILGLENGNQSLKELFIALKKDEKLAETFSFIEENIRRGKEPFVRKNAAELGFGHDREVAENLWKAFFVLGRYSAPEQIEKIRFYRENIQNRYRIQNDPLHKKAKLSRSMGLLGGLFLAVILI